jgi:hypothetical protein
MTQFRRKAGILAEPLLDSLRAMIRGRDLAQRSWDTRLHHPGCIALVEYRAICRKLSDGRSDDVLGVAGDMLRRAWCHGFRPTPEPVASALP